jgi:hypothetical protein
MDDMTLSVKFEFNMSHDCIVARLGCSAHGCFRVFVNFYYFSPVETLLCKFSCFIAFLILPPSYETCVNYVQIWVYLGTK